MTETVSRIRPAPEKEHPLYGPFFVIDTCFSNSQYRHAAESELESRHVLLYNRSRLPGFSPLLNCWTVQRGDDQTGLPHQDG